MRDDEESDGCYLFGGGTTPTHLLLLLLLLPLLLLLLLLLPIFKSEPNKIVKFIKSSQDYLVYTMPTRLEQRLDNIQRKGQATSMRQAAEWGMRAIQSSFPRLKDTFVYEETGER